MTYRVVAITRARADALEAFAQLAERLPAAAERCWLVRQPAFRGATEHVATSDSRGSVKYARIEK